MNEKNTLFQKCVNCSNEENLNFVKTFSAISKLNPELAMHDYEKHDWLDAWEPLRSWTRLELLKLIHADIQNKKHEGEEFYCDDCLSKLKWSVVEE